MNVQLKYFLGVVLLRLLREKGLTQKVVWERLGKKPGVVNAWFRGKSMPDSENLAELARVFGLTADALLDLTRREAARAPAPPLPSVDTPPAPPGEPRKPLPPTTRWIVQRLTEKPPQAVWVQALLELLEQSDEHLQRAVREALNAFRRAVGLDEKDLTVTVPRKARKRTA